MKYIKLLGLSRSALLAGCFAVFLNISPVWSQATDPGDGSEDTSGVCPGDGCSTSKVENDTLDVNAAGSITNVEVGTAGTVNINEDGSASGTNITTGGTVNVNDKGSANTTTIGTGGTMNVEGGGTAGTTTVNAGGTLNVKELGEVTGTTVNGGTMNVGGSASSTTINTDGVVSVESTGTVDNTTVNSGGQLTVAGEATNTSVSGEMSVSGTASETTINTGGAVTVESTGTVENTVIEGGYMDVAGTANGTEVNSGGATVGGVVHMGLNVSGAGAVANDTTVNNGGSMMVENSATANNTVINEGGTITVKDDAAGDAREEAATGGGSTSDGSTAEGATVSNTTVEKGGELIVEKGGTADYTTVQKDGKVTIKEYGLAKQTSLEGGSMTVETNGTAEGTIVNDDGKMTVDGNANSTTVNNGGSMIINDTAKVNGLEINDGGSYTLSTDADVSDATLYGKHFDSLFTNKTGDGLIVGARSSLTVKGDGKILNTEIRDSATVKIETGGSAEGTILGGEASVEADTGSTMTNTVINDGASVASKGSVVNTVVNSTSPYSLAGLHVLGTAENTIVNDKGTMSVAMGGKATGTIVNTGGTLKALVAGATLTDLSVHNGANLNLITGTTVNGSVLLNSGANLSGSYDYAGMASDAGIKNLTLTGGVHSVFQNNLVNNSAADDRTLTLADGSYKITSNTIADITQVSGWNELNIKNANVQLAGDLTMPSSDKKINIGSGATLNTGGQSITNITGSIVNEGTLSLISQAMINTTTIYGDYTAKSGSSIEVKVDGDNNTSDKLVINGDVVGDTNLIIQMASGTTPDQQIKFLETTGDDQSTASNFNIFRVNSNPYLWDTTHSGSDWYMGTVKQNGKAGVVSEVMAYMALPTAAIEQTRSLVYNVGAKVGNSRERKPVTRHDLYDRRYDKYYEPQVSAWMSPIYSSATIDAPFSVDADIVGGEAGIDLYSGVSNKVGVFGSYRKGEYDIDTNSSKYFSRYTSKIDIDSYIGGLYYRHDWENLWIIATVFGGVQNADITTKDRITESSDATQFGGSFTAWYNYNVNSNFDIQPTAGVSYTSISYDEIKDKYGKTAEYDDFNYMEAELGIKFEYSYEMYKGFSRLYVKPSLIQTMVSGDEAKILNLAGGSEAMDDATLTRIEVGGSMDIGYDFNLFTNVKYTFGSDYDDTVFSAGMNYAF